MYRIAVLSRVLFPFYSAQRHAFLMDHWWFRAIIVIYVATLLLAPPVLWFAAVDDAYEFCMTPWQGYDVLNQYRLTATEFCNDHAKRAWTSASTVQKALVNPLAVHYAFQLFAFRVVVDFVVLGGRRARESSQNKGE